MKVSHKAFLVFSAARQLQKVHSKVTSKVIPLFCYSKFHVFPPSSNIYFKGYCRVRSSSDSQKIFPDLCNSLNYSSKQFILECGDKYIHHTSNSPECMGVNGEALQLRAVYKKPYFVLQVTQESISVLQVMRESVSSA